VKKIAGQRLRTCLHPDKMRALSFIVGAIAQLGERLHGMQEVGGSIPPGSTKSGLRTGVNLDLVPIV
jgi:hypothetical protein